MIANEPGGLESGRELFLAASRLRPPACLGLARHVVLTPRLAVRRVEHRDEMGGDEDDP
jgi:hypothetical protein